jgi:Flp pilus assembly protein TadG
MRQLNQKIMHKWTRQRGIAAVEAAIVLPIVLFVIVVVAEFGHAIQQYNQLTQAVRDGARYIAANAEIGSGGGINIAAELDATRNLIVYGTTSASVAKLDGLTVDAITVTGVDGNNVLVSAEYIYTPLFLPNIPALVGTGDSGGAFTMNAEVTMRIL